MTKAKIPANIKAKIRKLSEIARDLRDGDWFNITRLLTVKGLCSEYEPASQFVFYLTKLRYEQMEDSERIKYHDEDEWNEWKSMLNETIALIGDYLNNKTEENKELLHKQFRKIEAVNNKFIYQKWGPVQMVECWDLMIAEYALKCILQWGDMPSNSYYCARYYAERSHSQYGKGLVVESAPLVEDIAAFWRNYYGI